MDPIEATATVNGELWSVLLVPLRGVTVTRSGEALPRAEWDRQALWAGPGRFEALPRELTLALRAAISAKEAS